jgi:hypothetical protein
MEKFKVRGRRFVRGMVSQTRWATAVEKKAPLGSVHGEVFTIYEVGPGPGTALSKDKAHTVLGHMRQHFPKYHWELRNA